jgi:hypothetical protein
VSRNGSAPGRRKNERINPSLRRALEIAEKQLDVPIADRLEGVGVAHRDMVGGMGNAIGPFVEKAMTNSIDAVQEQANSEDDSKFTRDCRKIIAWMNEHQDDDTMLVLPLLMQLAANSALVEGVVIGVILAAQLDRQAAHGARRRPGR